MFIKRENFQKNNNVPGRKQNQKKLKNQEKKQADTEEKNKFADSIVRVGYTSLQSDL